MSKPINIALAGSPYIIYGLLALVIIWIAAFGFSQRFSIVEGFKGKDKVWQFIELVMILWVFLFPLMVVMDLLGHHPSDKAWLFMELIFATSVTGKSAVKISENKYKSRENEKP